MPHNIASNKTVIFHDWDFAQMSAFVRNKTEWRRDSP